jgi:hypothetical protein
MNIGAEPRNSNQIDFCVPCTRRKNATRKNFSIRAFVVFGAVPGPPHAIQVGWLPSGIATADEQSASVQAKVAD